MQECCVTFPTMHAVVLLGTAILIGLIVVDWMAFNRQSPSSVCYGVVVGRHEEPLVVRRDRFDAEGLLHLPRGWARLGPEHGAVPLPPGRKRVGGGRRTAWPPHRGGALPALGGRAR